MRVKKEDDLLKIEVRKKIIADIQSNENQFRKDEAYRRHQCYKDMTKKHVVKELLKQFDSVTVNEMSYCVSNISFARKIIDKLARVYNNGVKRTAVSDSEVAPDENAKTPEQQATDMVEGVADVIEMDSQMQKTNRFLKLQKNVAVFVKPVPYDDNEDIYSLKLVVMPPFLYDVIENYHDRECAMAYVLSHYSPTGSGHNTLVATNAARDGRSQITPMLKPEGDGTDQTISNSAADKNLDVREYIFWSNKYHFTCNEKGEIIASTIGENDEPTPLNPIQKNPIVSLAIDQDGVYWAQGGDDLADGCILLNSMITNLNHIGITQGYGQFYAKGKNLPQNIKLGPNKAILMNVEDKDDPDPSIGFANANPPMQELIRAIEMYAALMLTTNNLTTTGISSSLETYKSAASGIALIIDKAESMEDVKDQQQVFMDREPEIFEIIGEWLNYYGSRDQLCDELAPYKDFPTGIDIALKFNDMQPIMSETEKLNNIVLREKMGLNTIQELLMKDDPALSEKDADIKLKKLLEDRIQNALLWATIQAGGAQAPAPSNTDKVDGGPGGDKNLGNVTGNQAGAPPVNPQIKGKNDKGNGGGGNSNQNGQ